ncbi:MAG: FAD-binding protein [Thiobacillus sp.]
MSVLILAEHENQKLKPSVAQLVSAAQCWKQTVHVLLVGNDLAAAAQGAAAITGVASVMCVEAPHLQHPLAEDVANIIAGMGREYSVILAAHSAFGRNALPRVAALLDVEMVGNVVEIQAPATYVRPIYVGNVFATVRSTDPIQVVTLRASRFDMADTGNNAEIVKLAPPPASGKTRWLSEIRNQSDRPELGSASVVVSGGRSLGSAENFESVLAPLADKLHGALGATRSAVDAGFAPNDIQIGQTGTVVAPELYIAVGISGAVQHTAGMQDSKIVVAINHDTDATIFQMADYGLVADLFEAVPALTATLP